MKKIFALLLSLVLLLGVFSGCESAPSEGTPGEEPSTPETAKVVWRVSDYLGNSVDYSHEDVMTDGLRDAFENETDENTLFCIETTLGEAVSDYLEENEITTYEEGNHFRYDPYGPYTDVLTAVVTREQLVELEEIGFWMGQGGPERPKGYAETINNALANTLEYLPRESYRVMVYTKKHSSSGKFSDEEKKECMDDILEKTDLKGCYTRNLYGGNEEFAKRDEEQFNDEGYELKADGEGYTGAMQLVLTKEQVMSLAENTRVKSIEIVPEYSDAYYITTLENGELTNQTEIVMYNE